MCEIRKHGVSKKHDWIEECTETVLLYCRHHKLVKTRGEPASKR